MAELPQQRVADGGRDGGLAGVAGGVPGADQATGTVRFGLEGTSYEVDLSQENADELATALEPYIAAARKTGSGPARRTARGPAWPARARMFAPGPRIRESRLRTRAGSQLS
ncbi:MAG: Lsr2 family protein [Actinomycetota bacterium]|nr:Lsr2 family protein [Actinomycetota bacterium]